MAKSSPLGQSLLVLAIFLSAVASHPGLHAQGPALYCSATPVGYRPASFGGQAALPVQAPITLVKGAADLPSEPYLVGPGSQVLKAATGRKVQGFPSKTYQTGNELPGSDIHKVQATFPDSSTVSGNSVPPPPLPTEPEFVSGGDETKKHSVDLSPYTLDNLKRQLARSQRYRREAIREQVNYPPDVPYMWAGVDYLRWRLKNGPLPVPLVTTGDPNDPIPGALGQPGTQVVFGNSNQNFSNANGARLSFGAWLDPDLNCGFEGRGFLLERRFTGFQGGTPDSFLYVPIFRADLGEERSFTINDPSVQLFGTTAISLTSRLWGAEANGLLNLGRNYFASLDFLYGFKYLSLLENLTIQSALQDPILDLETTLVDHFQTRNQFFGGQFGLQGALRAGRFGLTARLMLALGDNHQVVNIDGSNVSTVPDQTFIFPGGLFTQPTNIGRQHHDEFTVIPEAQLKVAFDLCRLVRVYGGYDFLYWTQVVRPGDQVDRSINRTQFGGGVLDGPARPMPLFNATDFWTHGFNLGMEVIF